MKKTIKIMKFLCLVLLFMIIIGPLKTNAEETRWFGSQLSGTEREVYNELAKNYYSIKHDQKFDLKKIKKTNPYINEKALEAFLDDYPEVYGMTSCVISDQYIIPKFYPDLAEEKNDIDNAIQNALTYVNTFDNDFDKIVAINDYIINNTTYGSSTYGGQTIMEGLLNKYGKKFVCAGHAKLFRLLCVKCNIPCIYVSNDDLDHAYNYVKYNNKWYVVDVTFNREAGKEFLMKGKDWLDEVYRKVSSDKSGLKLPDLAEESFVFLDDAVIDFPDNVVWTPTYTYTGQPIEPSLDVTVEGNYCDFTPINFGLLDYDSTTIHLQKDKDYKITFSNNINPGTAVATITGLGNCKGTRTIKFKIKKPKKKEPNTISKAPASVKVKINKNKVTVSWKKLKKTKKTKKILKKIKGIQVQYSTDKKFNQNVINKKIGNNKTKVTFKPKKKATYYVRVRYYGKDCVSKWSKIKKVKIK